VTIEGGRHEMRDDDGEKECFRSLLSIQLS
jgi:hypothetical protein